MGTSFRQYLLLSLPVFAAGALACGCAATSDPLQGELPPTLDHSHPSAQNQPAGHVPTTMASGDTVAFVNGQPVSREELVKPLVEAYGLNMLLMVVQRDLARQEMQRQGIPLSQQDIDDEHATTMQLAFPDAETKDYPVLLDQLLARQGLTRTQFDILMESNAMLRKLAGPRVVGKVSDENLHQAFGIRYGEQVRVRDLVLSDRTKIAEAKARLANGEAFEKVVMDMSVMEQTRLMGGLLPEFSRANNNYPKAFIDTAFMLKVGEVSDPVEWQGLWHLIKLEARIEPRVVKFDDVKDSLRKELESRWVSEEMKLVRDELGKRAIQGKQMSILDPVLAQQFEDRMTVHTEAAKDVEAERRKVAEDLRRRIGLTTHPAHEPPLPLLAPATQSTTEPTTLPSRYKIEPPTESTTAPAPPPAATTPAPTAPVVLPAGIPGVVAPASQPTDSAPDGRDLRPPATGGGAAPAPAGQ